MCLCGVSHQKTKQDEQYVCSFVHNSSHSSHGIGLFANEFIYLVIYSCHIYTFGKMGEIDGIWRTMYGSGEYLVSADIIQLQRAIVGSVGDIEGAIAIPDIDRVNLVYVGFA